ncbi:MAG: ExbD/TolR family protein [Maricaulaceae bacterium]|nr:ExbD/TolR family protein [Maricaulaceae bacterium]
MGLSVNSRGKGGRWSPKADINVAPLVDVMLVLLIVFMITAPLLTVGVPVNLPRTEARALPASDRPLTITVMSDGRVFIQETEVEADALVPQLRAIAGTGYAGRVYIRADAGASYGTVAGVMARVSAGGFTNLGLVTDPLEQNR